MSRPSAIQRKADDETSAGGWFSPNVAAVIENSLTGQGQPKPAAVWLACRDKRLEQPVANPTRNARPRSTIGPINSNSSKLRKPALANVGTVQLLLYAGSIAALQIDAPYISTPIRVGLGAALARLVSYDRAQVNEYQ